MFVSRGNHWNASRTGSGFGPVSHRGRWPGAGGDISREFHRLKCRRGRRVSAARSAAQAQSQRRIAWRPTLGGILVPCGRIATAPAAAWHACQDSGPARLAPRRNMATTLPAPLKDSSGVLAALAIAAIASVAVWLLHAPRFFVFSQASYGGFWNRNLWMLLHVVGGTLPLFIGPFLVWSGLQRWKPRLHRALGRTYLLVGAVSVGAGAGLSVMATQEPRGMYAATFALALAWFFAAGMAYRAIRNRRIEQHRQWVTRSYVLTLTFVACRMVMRVPGLETMGPQAIVATIWASWIIPLLVTEVCLQWRATGKQAG